MSSHVYVLLQYLFYEAPITGEVKRILKDHLGSLWEQLAYKMGMTKWMIHIIKAENSRNVGAQIDKFLNGGLQFPWLPTIQQTASLLVEIMEKASLPEVAKDVHRGFLSFGLKENGALTCEVSLLSYNYHYYLIMIHILEVYPGRPDPYRPVS